MELAGKNILFISPEFFGVDHSIINELKRRGARVIWFDERSVKSSFGRAINSVQPALFKIYSDKYYKQQIEKIEEKIDFILVIKGEMISAKSISLFRKKWSSAEMILYFYDPVDNIKGIMNKVPLYDRVISFEPKDCKKYGFEFRPLFSDFENRRIENTRGEISYDVCFYGTMYGDRFEVVSQMKKYCHEKNLKFYSFCFLRGKFMALYYWITNRGFRKMGISGISFVPRTSSELAAIVRKSKVILDTNERRQQGLTIRTLETLLSSKKMITTNDDIVNYDFYNPRNICVVDRTNMSVPVTFFDEAYEKVDEEILSKYTAKGWVDDVFGKQEV